MLNEELIAKIKDANPWLSDVLFSEGRFKVTEDINIATHWLCLPDQRHSEENDHVTDYVLYRLYVDKAEDEVIIFDDIESSSVVFTWHQGYYICIDDEYGSREMSQPAGNFLHLFCVADRSNGFPNFYPIGVYVSAELAKKELEDLPKNKHYQLFQKPINQFFGRIEEDDRLTSGLGYLSHSHFDSEDEEGMVKPE